MCQPGILIPLMILLGIGVPIASLIGALTYVFISFVFKFVKFKLKYFILILLIGAITMSIPLGVRMKHYLGYPGPSYSQKSDLKTFIESRTWREKSSCGIALYEFKSDGTYSELVLDDVANRPVNSGKWRFVESGRGVGTIYIERSSDSYTQNNSISQTPSQIEIKARGKLLWIDSKIYYGSSSPIASFRY